jgi:hypothetical protein
LIWASAAEGAYFAEQAAKIVEEVRALGPLNWKGDGRLQMEAHMASAGASHPSGTEVHA